MIVLDACAICEMVRQTEKGQALKSLALRNEVAISCELVRAEVVSVFRKLARTEKLSPKEAEGYVEAGLNLIDEFKPIEPLQAEALRESMRLDRSPYDMFYCVLARRTGATLFTTDKKLMKLCEKHGVDCVSEIELGELT